MRYIVTGAAGFIGSRVAEQLLDAGAEVVGLDNLNEAYDTRLKRWRLQRLQARTGFRFHQVDICDRDAIAAVFRDRPSADAILNLAARAGVRPSVADPWIYSDANYTGTLNLLDVCVRHDIPKFVLSSTSSLYGAEHERPFVESAPTDRPLSPYAASKKAAEVLCYTYHHLHGIDVTALRYFTVYGPAGRPDMAPFRFVQWIREGRPLRLYGDGLQERDFTYVDDVARGTVAALRPVGYEVVNLGSDRPVPLMDVIRLIERLTDARANIERHDMHRADVRATWASIAKAAALLDWRPETDLETGFRHLVEWYDANRDWAREIRTDE